MVRARIMKARADTPKKYPDWAWKDCKLRSTLESLFAATTATMYSYSLLHWLVGRVGTGDFGRLAASQEFSSTLGTLEKSICWQRPT